METDQSTQFDKISSNHALLIRLGNGPLFARLLTTGHCFATYLVADGHDIRMVQELLGHKAIRTMMIYTHVLNRSGRDVRSPAVGLAHRLDDR